jgi:hypothetical protein
MRYAIPIISFLLLQVSCTAHLNEHAQLMREIDAAIVMPEQALPLDRYARYFSLRPDGKVVGFYTAYVRDEGPKPADYGCSEITRNNTLVDVPCGPDDSPRAGEKHWVRYNEMPEASDGRCSIINVVYNRTVRRIEKVWCNGPS